MTENIRSWTQGHAVVQIELLNSHNPRRMHISEMPQETGICTGIVRRGKTTILSFETGYLLLSYQLSGKLIRATDSKTNNTRAVITLSDGKKLLWVDKINFGSIEWFKTLKQLKHKQRNLGPEFWPIQRDGTWWRNTCTSKSAIHKVLIDQKRVAGIGNIIALETLHRSKIHPCTPANTISSVQWNAIATAVRTVVQRSHEHHNRIREIESKEKDFNGNLNFVSEGHTQAEGYLIYGRDDEMCPQCMRSKIMKDKLGGRPIYFCPTCQKKNR